MVRPMWMKMSVAAPRTAPGATTQLSDSTLINFPISPSCITTLVIHGPVRVMVNNMGYLQWLVFSELQAKGSPLAESHRSHGPLVRPAKAAQADYQLPDKNQMDY